MDGKNGYKLLDKCKLLLKYLDILAEMLHPIPSHPIPSHPKKY